MQILKKVNKKSGRAIGSFRRPIYDLATLPTPKNTRYKLIDCYTSFDSQNSIYIGNGRRFVYSTAASLLNARLLFFFRARDCFTSRLPKRSVTAFTLGQKRELLRSLFSSLSFHGLFMCFYWQRANINSALFKLRALHKNGALFKCVLNVLSV